VRRVRAREPHTLQVDFSIRPAHQFDQGGLVVWRDADTWLKTGIEVVDGKPRLSCVVTRHGFSDWSTQPWAAMSMRIRLSQMGDGSYVVEAAPCTAEPRELEFCRIAYLPVAIDGDGGGGAEAAAAVELPQTSTSSASATEAAAAPAVTSAAAASSAEVHVGVFACCPASQNGGASLRTCAGDWIHLPSYRCTCVRPMRCRLSLLLLLARVTACHACICLDRAHQTPVLRFAMSA
jgi:regulation of enolase protein 1 (concanavalin A-like superfamily)